MDITTIQTRLKGTLFEGCVTLDEDGEFYFRYDTTDNDSREAYEEYCEVVDILDSYGLLLHDHYVEHDCITGVVVDREWHKLRQEVLSISKQRIFKRLKGES